MKKKFALLIILSGIMLGGVSANAQTVTDSDILLYAENQLYNTKLKNVDGQLYISSRDASELLDAGIMWNDTTKTLTIFEANHTLVFKVDKEGYYSNAMQMFSVNKPIIIDEKCYISLIDVLKGSGRQYNYFADGSISLTGINYTSPQKDILTSEEYAQQYLYNKPYYNNYYQSSNAYTPPYSNSTDDYQGGYTNEYQKYIDESLEKAAQAKEKAEELQKENNKSLYEQACQQAYIEYQRAKLNAASYGSYANSYLESARIQYESKLEMYKEMYGM